MPTPLQDGKVVIARWEGLWQAMAGDPGNYLDGRLIGTMRGVTPAVLMAHLGVLAATITPAFMQQTVTLDLAAEIYLKRYYQGWIDPLRWQACASVVTDFGWGSGPGQAVKSTERDLLGLTNADFKFDATSVSAWASRDDLEGMAKMCTAFYGVRERFYDLICERNPTLQQFRAGWHNRSAWYLPTPNGEWWSHWQGESTDAVVDAVQRLPPSTVPALLSKGSRGDDVWQLQRRINEWSFAELGIVRMLKEDGDFGKLTEDAVKKFQAANGLVVDGWVGPATRGKLGMM